MDCQKLIYGIFFNLVYPSSEIKEEYIERYRVRGNNDAFVKLLTVNYDSWINELKSQSGCNHIQLTSGQYLLDVLNK